MLRLETLRDEPPLRGLARTSEGSVRAGGLTLLVAIAFLASFAWEMTKVPLFANLAGRSFLRMRRPALLRPSAIS